ncbi:MAG: transferase [Burkholderiales bacterium PBB5]|nr:MAG: transferase [Burkholderiales bacterium PBB5]
MNGAQPFVVDSRQAKALHFGMATVQSRMRLDDPDALDLDYTRTMMAALLFVPDPRRIAMVGLGGGSLPKFCHRHLPAACIAVVEISAEVIALRDDFQVPADGPRFQVLHDDGAQWLRRGITPVDLLMVDGFDAQGLPEALATQRFFDDCRAALAPGGLLVMNLHRDDPRHGLLLDRLRRSFDDDGAVLAVADSDGGNVIVMACSGTLLARYRPGVVRLPAGLDKSAHDALLAACAQVMTALVDQQQRRLQRAVRPRRS